MAVQHASGASARRTVASDFTITLPAFGLGLFNAQVSPRVNDGRISVAYGKGFAMQKHGKEGPAKAGLDDTFLTY